MFIDVQPFVLNASRNTQAMDLLDGKEEYDTAGGCPQVDNQNPKQFGTEETPTVAIQSTIIDGEQTCHQCAKYAADTMHRACTNGVVDVQHMVDKFDGKYQHRTADETDNDSTYG